MNTDTLLELFQKGYRVTLGAASSAVEAVKDPQRAADEFSEIGTDFQRLTEKLEVRGALTEKEARDFVEGVVSQMPEPLRSVSSNFSQNPTMPKTVTTVATPVVDAGLQAEVEALTAELITMRKEIDELRQKN
jgi:polyhydroxyalkanoate synthesis regulator phasin